jgi:hypothetical protein
MVTRTRLNVTLNVRRLPCYEARTVHKVQQGNGGVIFSTVCHACVGAYLTKCISIVYTTIIIIIIIMSVFRPATATSKAISTQSAT